MMGARYGFVFAAALVAMTGCSSGDPAVNFVQGTVTIDGKPLDNATVIFSPIEGSGGRPATGKTDASGVYTLTDMQATGTGAGAAAGQYRVAITKVIEGSLVEGPGEDAEGADDAAEDAGAGSPTAAMVMKSEIPESYGRADSSGLTATVQAGKNENVDFELSSAP